LPPVAPAPVSSVPPPASNVPASFSTGAVERPPSASEDVDPILDWSDARGEGAGPSRGRASFDDPARFMPVSEDTGEVTGAVTGVPAPLSAVAATPPPIVPPVLRVPAASSAPWSPSRSPLPESEAFPDTSGPVSAIAGAPDAGSPRSARSSVSAQNRRPQIPDDPLEETIIARRRRTDWSLIPLGGEPIAIGAEVVLLGRRPATDPANPGAQLIVIDDGTVSKTHARLQLRGDKWYVTDLGSTNGVVFATVMGTEVEATPGVEIEAGDRFLLGDAEVRLVRSAE
ncbi:FHA domain-containing protein, partial [Planococcus sp. APC 4015]|nr:FHA domain-containing protein [Planococcus sp. APC 4015]